MEANEGGALSPQLLEFLYQQAGGKEQALQRFHEEKIGIYAAEGRTLGDLLELADKEGWTETLRSYDLRALQKLLLQPEQRVPAENPPGHRLRLSAAQDRVARQAIKKAFGTSHWLKKKGIATAINRNPALQELAAEGLQIAGMRLLGVLKRMVDEGELKCEAERERVHWYALANERTKPPFDAPG